MLKRFATLTLIALMLGAAPAVFAQGSGGSGGGSGGSGGGGGRSDGPGNNPVSPGTPSSPRMGNQTEPPASGAIIQNSPNTPGRSSNQNTPGAAGQTPTGPIDNAAQATTTLQAQGYSNVQGLVRAGDVYRGRAVRDGRTVMIEMDARTGAVRETSG